RGDRRVVRDKSALRWGSRGGARGDRRLSAGGLAVDPRIGIAPAANHVRADGTIDGGNGEVKARFSARGINDARRLSGRRGEDQRACEVAALAGERAKRGGAASSARAR